MFSPKLFQKLSFPKQISYWIIFSVTTSPSKSFFPSVAEQTIVISLELTQYKLTPNHSSKKKLSKVFLAAENDSNSINKLVASYFGQPSVKRSKSWMNFSFFILFGDLKRVDLISYSDSIYFKTWERFSISKNLQRCFPVGRIWSSKLSLSLKYFSLLPS